MVTAGAMGGIAVFGTLTGNPEVALIAVPAASFFGWLGKDELAAALDERGRAQEEQLKALQIERA